jgi:hypothetical protein
VGSNNFNGLVVFQRFNECYPVGFSWRYSPNKIIYSKRLQQVKILLVSADDILLL